MPDSPRGAAPLARGVLALWAREGKWAEIPVVGISMTPLIPDGSRLTVRFGRQGLSPGDVVLYAAGERLVAHRVLRLGRRGRRWGFLKLKGDPVRPGEAAWVPVEEILGRVVAVRRLDGRTLVLNTSAGRLANRAAALISGAGGVLESRLRSVLRLDRRLAATPAALAMLLPVYRGRSLVARESGRLLREEERFLIAGAGPFPTAEEEQRLRRLVRRDVPWERVVPAACALGLGPLLFRNLSRAGVRERVPAHAFGLLARNARAVACRTAIQLEALDRILDALREDGIEPILLKGVALGLQLYEQPALRPMQDLDLLVEAEQVARSVTALERLGFRRLRGGRSPEFYAAHHHTTPMIEGDGRVIVEVHRGLVPPEEGLRLDPVPLIGRSVHASARGRTYRVLCREDQVLHAALHLSYADRFVGRLRDLIDVRALLGAPGRGIEWGRLLEVARAPEAARSVYATLDLARRLLGAEIPAEVLHELRRSTAWGPVSERLLRLLARSSLFAGTGADRLLNAPSARWACDAFIRRTRWSARLRDLVQLFGEA